MVSWGLGMRGCFGFERGVRRYVLESGVKSWRVIAFGLRYNPLLC